MSGGDLLTPKQVARAIGVSESSVCRWCDKGLLPVERTAGGHRRLKLADVLSYICRQGLAVTRPEILDLPASTGTGRVVTSRAQRQMTEALRRGAAEEVRGIGFDLLLAGWDVADIFDFVIAPAFDTLGRQWSEGSLHIYQERRAVEVCRQLIDDLRRKTTNSHPESAAPRAIHATLAGDPYVLPNAMIDLVLRTAGWRTDNIGRGLPLQSVCAAVRDLKPQLLVLSISQLPTDLFNHWPELSRCTDEIGARTIAGGQALNPAILNRLGQEPHENTMRHLAALVR